MSVEDILKEFESVNEEDGAGVATSAPFSASVPSVQPDAGIRKGIGYYVADVGKGILDGTLDAVEEIHQLSRGALNWLDNKAGLDLIDDEYTRILPDINLNTPAGKLASGITKFTVGMIGAGKVMKGFKLLQGASKASKIAHTLVQGALTDFTMNDPGEDRLSNLIEAFPALRNPVTEFLSAEEDEGQIEGRLKAALEGMLVSSSVDLFMKGLKVYKKALVAGKVGGAEATQKVLDEAAPELFKDLTKTVDPTGLKVINNASGKVGTIVDFDAGVYKVAFRNKKGGEETVEALTKDQLTVLPKSHAMTDEDVIKELEKSAVVTNEQVEKRLVKQNKMADTEAVIKNIEANFDNPDWFAEGLSEGGVINFDYYDGPEAGAKVIKAYEDASLAVLKKRVGSGKWKDVIVKSYNFMNEVLGDPSGFLKTAEELGDISLEIASKAHGIGNLVVHLSNDVASISRQVLNPETSTPALKLKLIHRIQLLDEALQHYKAIKTGVARTLNSFKIPIGNLQNMDLEQLYGVLDEFGGQKFIDQLARRLANVSPKDAAKIVASSKGNIFWAVNNELWINNVLSGIKTHVVNATATLAHSALFPLTKIAGGLAVKDKELMEEGARMYYAYGKFFTENVKMMAKAFKYGTNILDSSATVFDRPFRAISSDFLGINNPHTAKIVDAIGEVINLPSRFLMTSDEFFKQMTYRAELYGRFFVKGRRMGLSGDALEEFINRNMQEAFTVFRIKTGIDEMGNPVYEEVLGKGIIKEALDVANEVGFTTPLKKGLSKDLSKITMEYPYLRMILPFIKTPTNLIRTAGMYTPGVNMLMPSFRKALEAGGRERAMALGKLMVGSALWSTGIILATQGKITGGGPKDPKKRALLFEAGWQPYSFVVTGEDGRKEYISFSRLDPFASFFGLCGDFTDIADQISDMELLDLTLAMGTALAKNLTSKTYLRGLSETLEALNEPEMSLGKWIKRQAAAYVPLSSLMNDLAKIGDDEMREAWSILDHVKSRLPGFSETLPPKYSWVTGNPIKIQEGLGPDAISPFTTSEVKGWVQEELARLNYGFAPPSKEIRGVELTPEQYSRLCQLHGTVKINGKTLLESLEYLMKLPEYDLKRERVDDSKRPDDIVDHRIKAIQRVIGAYRIAATRQLIAEDESLRNAILFKRMEKKAWRSGNPDEIEALGQLIEMSE